MNCSIIKSSSRRWYRLSRASTRRRGEHSMRSAPNIFCCRSVGVLPRPTRPKDWKANGSNRAGRRNALNWRRKARRFRRQSSPHADRQAFTRVLVDQGQHPQRSVRRRAVVHHVPSPHVIVMLRPTNLARVRAASLSPDRSLPNAPAASFEKGEEEICIYRPFTFCPIGKTRF